MGRNLFRQFVDFPGSMAAATSERTMAAPSWARRMAMAAPRPPLRPAPVMTAVLPLKRFSMG
jgi:hypothetical protein